MSSWIGIFALSALSLFIMLLPLWQRRLDRTLGVGIETNDIAKQWEMEKDRLVKEQNDLDVALAEGGISTETHEQERAEVVADAQRALKRLQQAQDAQSKLVKESDHKPQVYKQIGFIFCALMLVATGGLSYYLKGQDIVRQVAQNEEQKIGKAEIEKMVSSLEARVKAGGTSQKEQLMLARAYSVMGRKDDSIGLYNKIHKQDKTNLDAIMALGEIYFSSDDKQEQNRALGFFNQALNINPDKADALWFKSLALLRKRKLKEARIALVRLKDVAEGNEKVQKAVSQLLTELDKNGDRVKE